MAHGKICHVELPSQDLDASRDFYERVFGWTFESVPGFDGYLLFRTPGGLGGAIAGGQDAEPASKVGPIVYLETVDIDRTLEQIESLGGVTLRPKTKISDAFGYEALFLDNVGNRLGLWSQ